jgi:Protein of unknown function (DUF2384)
MERCTSRGAGSAVGDKHEALRWLGTPVRALNFATPISLLDKPDGKGLPVPVTSIATEKQRATKTAISVLEFPLSA